MGHPLDSYLRLEKIPTVFCSGCGCGTTANIFLHAVKELGYKSLRGFVFVSGIGCSSWIPSPHFKADTIHTLHGRAIPVATGIALTRPDLKVVVFGGDGDLGSIGLNHLVHAARRNVNILTIMVNNLVYAMTGGQSSPTTPKWLTGIVSFKSSIRESTLDICRLVADAGASYVARWSVLHVNSLKNSFKKALEMKGFRFIEVVAQCTSRISERLKLTPLQYLKMLARYMKPINDIKEGELDIIPIGEYT